MSSNTKVTITLGRSGKVVTKESFKRPPVERTWSYANGFSSLSSNKRHRGDDTQRSSGLAGKNGSQIAPNDLRLKLMRKRQKRDRGNFGKHETVSRSSETPVSYQMLSSRPSSSRYSNLKPVRADEFRSGFSRADSYRGTKTNPSQIMGGPRARSPNRLFRATQELPPPRNSSQVQRTEPIRNGDFSSRPSLLRSSSPLTPVRPTPQTANPVPRVAQSNETPKQVWQKVDVPATVPSLLHSLGLGKYCITFQAEEVDMTVLKQMKEKDLKDMGIPMGPRKKILLALLPPLKKPTSS